MAAGAREAVLIEGEAGIGKTRLIAECLGSAREHGFTMAHGTADEVEQARPCGVLLAAFEESAPELGPQLKSSLSEPGDRTLEIVDALVAFCEAAAKTSPVVLVLDDLHWADAETLRALRALIRRTASIPFALITSCRPPAGNPELEALIEAIVDDGLHIDLEPLDDTAVAALLETLVADPLASALVARVASAHGNPFFVIEIAGSDPDERDGAEIRATSGGRSCAG